MATGRNICWAVVREGGKEGSVCVECRCHANGGQLKNDRGQEVFAAVSPSFLYGRGHLRLHFAAPGGILLFEKKP